MSYYINQIKNNVYNQYKYHYLDHMEGIIDIHDNYWSFAINLYSINDFNLPVSSVCGDLSLPFQQIKNISFNLSSDQTDAKTDVKHNPDYSHIYSGYFDVDISQNEYLKQDLENVNLNLNLSLFIDPEAAKGAGDDIKQDVLDKLMTETSEQRWNFSLYYTNTHYIKQSTTIDNIVQYELPFGNDCFPVVKEMNVSLNHLEKNNEPINKLVTLSSDNKFQVIAAKVKFYYWIELGTQGKQLEKTLNVDKQTTKNLDIFLDDYTIFDYEKNELVFDPIGAKGFYIPKYSQGYYELEIQVIQDDVTTKLFIKNNFIFGKEIQQPYIGITHKTINNIDDFKEVIY